MTSVDVECLFSQGQLLLSHVCSHLSVESTWALLCLGTWSELQLIKDEDVKKVTELPDVAKDVELENCWDSLT